MNDLKRWNYIQICKANVLNKSRELFLAGKFD